MLEKCRFFRTRKPLGCSKYLRELKGTERLGLVGRSIKVLVRKNFFSLIVSLPFPYNFSVQGLAYLTGQKWLIPYQVFFPSYSIYSKINYHSLSLFYFNNFIIKVVVSIGCDIGNLALNSWGKQDFVLVKEVVLEAGSEDVPARDHGSILDSAGSSEFPDPFSIERRNINSSRDEY